MIVSLASVILRVAVETSNIDYKFWFVIVCNHSAVTFVGKHFMLMLDLMRYLPW